MRHWQMRLCGKGNAPCPNGGIINLAGSPKRISVCVCQYRAKKRTFAFKDSPTQTLSGDRNLHKVSEEEVDDGVQRHHFLDLFANLLMSERPVGLFSDQWI